MIIDPLFYAMAIPSVVLIGLSKGGLTGIGALAVPLMAIVASPLQAAAVLMPILLILDLVAVWTDRKTFDKITLAITIPASVIGIVIGAILVAQVNPNWVRIIIGFIAISFTMSYWRTNKETKSQKQPQCKIKTVVSHENTNLTSSLRTPITKAEPEATAVQSNINRDKQETQVSIFGTFWKK